MTKAKFCVALVEDGVVQVCIAFKLTRAKELILLRIPHILASTHGSLAEDHLLRSPNLYQDKSLDNQLTKCLDMAISFSIAHLAA